MPNYTTPNGKVFTKEELVELYGQDTFEQILRSGQIEETFQIKETPSAEVQAEEEFVTPNGQSFSKSQLVEMYGEDGFEKFVTDGQVKKKDQDPFQPQQGTMVSQSGVGSSAQSSGQELDDGTFLGSGQDEEFDVATAFLNPLGDFITHTKDVPIIGWMGEFIDDMARSYEVGQRQAKLVDAAESLFSHSNIANASPEEIQTLIEASKKLEEIGPSSAMMEFQKKVEEGGDIGDFFAQIFDNPRLATELIVSSYRGMASNPALAGGGAVIGAGAAYGAATGAAAGGVGAAPGAVAGAGSALPYAMGVMGGITETMITFADLLKEEVGEGYDEEKIRKVLQDPEKVKDIRYRAAARGATIGVIDALTGRLGGAAAKAIGTASKAKRAGGKLAAIAIEMPGASLGEAAGQAVAGQELEASEIFLEGIAEGPMGLVSAASGTMKAPKITVAGNRLSEKEYNEMLKVLSDEEISALYSEGEIEISGINEKEYKAQLSDIQRRSQIRSEVIESNSNLSEFAIEEITNLEFEKQKLEGKKTRGAKKKLAELESQIDEIAQDPENQEKKYDIVESIFNRDIEKTKEAIDNAKTEEEYLELTRLLESQERNLEEYLSSLDKEKTEQPSTLETTQEETSEKTTEAVEEIEEEETKRKQEKEKPGVDVSEVPQIVPVDEAGVPLSSSDATIANVINRPARLVSIGKRTFKNPLNGEVFQDGQRVVFESKDGKQYDLGNVQDIAGKPLSEIEGFSLLDFKPNVEASSTEFALSEEGRARGAILSINGQDHRSVPKAIKRNAKGEIVSVRVKPIEQGGKAFDLKGQDAEDAAYLIMLDEFEKQEQQNKIDYEVRREIEEREVINEARRKAKAFAKERADADIVEDVQQEEQPAVTEEVVEDTEAPVQEDVLEADEEITFGDYEVEENVVPEGLEISRVYEVRVDEKNPNEAFATVDFVDEDGDSFRSEVALRKKEATPVAEEVAEEATPVAEEVAEEATPVVEEVVEEVTPVAEEVTEEVEEETVPVKKELTEEERKGYEEELKTLENSARERVAVFISNSRGTRRRKGTDMNERVTYEITGTKDKPKYIMRFSNAFDSVKEFPDKKSFERSLARFKKDKDNVDITSDVISEYGTFSEKRKERIDFLKSRLEQATPVTEEAAPVTEEAAPVAEEAAPVAEEDAPLYTKDEVKSINEKLEERNLPFRVRDESLVGKAKGTLNGLYYNPQYINDIINQVVKKFGVRSFAARWRKVDPFFTKEIVMFERPPSVNTFEELILGHILPSETLGRVGLQTTENGTQKFIEFAKNAGIELVPLELGDAAPVAEKTTEAKDAKPKAEPKVDKAREGIRKIDKEIQSLYDEQAAIISRRKNASLTSKEQKEFDSKINSLREQRAKLEKAAPKKTTTTTERVEAEADTKVKEAPVDEKVLEKQEKIKEIDAKIQEIKEERMQEVLKRKSLTLLNFQEESFRRRIAPLEKEKAKLEGEIRSIENRKKRRSQKGDVTSQELADIQSFFDESEKVSEKVSESPSGIRRSIVKRAIRNQVKKAKRVLISILPDTKIVILEDTNSYVAAVRKEDSSADPIELQTERGSFVNNTIYINLDNANLSTVAHEVFHAILLDRFTSEQLGQALTEMIEAVNKVANPELKQRILDFSDKYYADGVDIRNEELMAELVGILSSTYTSLPESDKNIIQRIFEKLAKLIGYPVPKRLNESEKTIIRSLNSISNALSTGRYRDILVEETLSDFGQAGVGDIISSIGERRTSASNGITNRRRQKGQPLSANEIKAQKQEIAEYISQGIAAGFKESRIRDYLVRVKRYKASYVDEMIGLSSETIPDGFANVEGGQSAGFNLFKAIDSFYKKLLKDAESGEFRLTRKEVESLTSEFARNARKKYDTIAQIDEKVADYRKKMENKGLSKGDVNEKVAEFRAKLYEKRDNTRTVVNQEILDYAKRMNEKNDKKKVRPTENQLMDEVISFLEEQEAYKKANEEEQVEMIRGLQKFYGVNSTKLVADRVKSLRSRVMAAKKSNRNLKKLQKDVIKVIKSSLPKSQYNKPEVIKLIEKVQAANEANIESIINEVSEIITEKNVSIVESVISKKLNAKYEITEGSRKKARGISAEANEVIQEIKKMISDKDSEADVEKKIQEMSKELDELEQGGYPTMNEIRRAVALEIGILLNSAKLLEDSSQTKLETLSEALSNIEMFIDMGNSELMEEIALDKSRQRSLVTMGLQDILGEKVEGIDDPDADVRNEAEKKLRTKVKDLSLDNAFKNKFIKLVKGLFTALPKGFDNLVLVKAEALYGLVDRIANLSSDLIGGFLQQNITGRIDRAGSSYKRNQLQNQALIQQKLKDLFGRKWQSKMRKARKQVVLKGLYTDAQRVQEATDEYNNKKNPTRKDKAKLNEIKGKYSLILAPEQMYYLYNQYKDPANRPSFYVKYGGEENAKQIMEAIEKYLTDKEPKLKEFADWQVNEFFPSLYDRYNDVYRRLYKTNMPQNEFYAGRIYREGRDMKGIDLMDEENVKAFKASVIANSTKARVKNTNPIKDMMGTDVLNTYLTEMEYFAAYAEAVKDVSVFLENKTVKSAIESKAGKEVYKALRESIKRIANRGASDKFADKLMNKLNDVFIVGRLALSPVIMIKQLTSAFAFADDIGITNWIAQIADIGKMRSTMKEIKENSAYMQDRKNNSIFRAIESYSNTSDVENWIPSRTKSFIGDFLMWTTKFGDATAIYAGGAPNYLYYKKKFMKANPNATEQEAIDYAIPLFESDTKKAQQSGDLVDKDYYQTGDPVARALNMFMTTPKQYLRKEMFAMRNMYRKIRNLDMKAGSGTFIDNARSLVMYHVFLPVLFQYVAMGLPGVLREPRDEDEDDLLRAAILGNLNALFAVGEIFQGIADLLSSKPYAGESSKSIGLVSGALSAIRKWKRFMNTEDYDKQEKALWEATTETATAFGMPANTVVRFHDNYTKVLDGDTDDVGEDILRLLNYSEYQISGPQKRESKEMTIEEQNAKYRRKKEKEMKKGFGDGFGDDDDFGDGFGDDEFGGGF